MAYTKQTWADLPSKTTPINAARLGHIEDGIYDAASVADTANSGLANKVDKVAGYGLSKNNYSDTDKTKVDGLGTAASKDSTNAVTQASTDLVESGAVYASVNAVAQDLSDANLAITALQTASTNLGKYKAEADSIAPVELDATGASQAYAVDEQFYLIDVLLTATSPIAQNDAIVVYPTAGYNCKPSDSVTGQIKAVAEKEATAEYTESGNPIVIENGYEEDVKGLTVDLLPIQDLHGYDKPWVGGAGKNLLPMTVAGLKTINTSGTWSGNAYTLNGVTFTIQTDADENVTGIKVTGTASANTIFNLVNNDALLSALGSNTYTINGCTNGSASTYFIYGYKINNNSTSVQLTTGDASFVWNTSTSGANITLQIMSGYAIASGGLLFKPMIRLSTESDATFEPYTNICPISGRTQAKVSRCGKNLCNPNTFVQGILNVNTGLTATNANWITTDYINVSDLLSVVVSGYRDGTEKCLCVRCVYYDKNKNFLSGSTNPDTSGNSEWHKTLGFNSNVKYIRLSFGFDNKATTISAFFATNRVQIEAGSQATAYEPYNGLDVTVDFNGTIYGGEVDFNTGVVTVTRGYTKVSDLIWNTQVGNYARFVASINNSKFINNESMVISDIYPSYSNAGKPAYVDGCYVGSGTPNVLKVYDTAYPETSDLDAWKVARADNVFCYELATPYTIQLTPAQLRLLKGYNYVTADGNINLDYIGTVKEWVEEELDKLDGEKVDNTVVGNVEDRATCKKSGGYSANDLFIRNGKIGKATTSIAQGATFTLNTNYIETDIGSLITALLNA